MIILYLFLAGIVVSALGFIFLGIQNDKHIWQSAWGNFKHKREMKKRKRHGM